MNATADLLAECDAQDILLSLDDGDGLMIDAPEGAITPGLLKRMKTHKRGLVAILRGDADGQNTTAGGEASPDPIGNDGWPVDSIDASEVEPCGQCGSLELWQSILGNWRCQKCNPPAAMAHELKQTAARLRKRGSTVACGKRQGRLMSQNTLGDPMR